MMKHKNILATASLAVAMSVASSATIADIVYEVTITNITSNILFTPILVASHGEGIKVFQAGQPASSELESIAEGGDIGPMATALNDNPDVHGVADSGDVLLAGASVTVEVPASGGSDYISVASMMLPTNDGFIAVNGMAAPAPLNRTTTVYHSPGFDAGTETNDELCDHIPGGGGCEGEAFSPDDLGEGYVHVHPGIHGIGDLGAAAYDWRNPVAMIAIKRVLK